MMKIESSGVSAAMTVWRKSVRSGGNGHCLEVAEADSYVAVRDSKDPLGPVLVVSRGQWSLLLNEVKRGRLDL